MHSHDYHSKPRFIPLILSVVGWFMSLIIGVVIGLALINSSLYIPFFPLMFSKVLGWFLIIVTLSASVFWFFDND